MSWVRLDTGFVRHPKITGLALPLRWAHIKAMCHAAEFATDGHISPNDLREMGVTKGQAEALEASGVWDRNGSGWVIHDWLDFNLSRADEEERRRKEREKKRRQRARMSPGDRGGDTPRDTPRDKTEI
jgi:hypothetical protein